MKKTQKKILLFSLIILLVLLMTAVSLLNYGSRPSDTLARYERHLFSSEFKEAGKVFSTEIRGALQGEQGARVIVLRWIESLKQSYSDGELTVAAAVDSVKEARAANIIQENSVLDQAEKDILTLSDTKDSYAAAKQFFANGKFEQALEELDQIMHADPNFSQAQSLQYRANLDLRSFLMSETERRLAANDFEAAYRLLAEHQKYFADDRDYFQMMSEIGSKDQSRKLDQYEENIRQAMADEEYTRAIETLHEAKMKLPNQARLFTLQDEIQKKISDSYLTASLRHWANGQLRAAMEAVDAGLLLLPDNPYLLTRKISLQRLMSMPDTVLQPSPAFLPDTGQESVP